VLRGVAQALQNRAGNAWQEPAARDRQDSLDQARAHLGDEQLERAYARGMALSLDLAIGQPIQRDRHRRNPVGRMTGKSPAAADTAAGLEPQTTAHTHCSFWRAAAAM
jgi:hypothetical protein